MHWTERRIVEDHFFVSHEAHGVVFGVRRLQPRVVGIR
jgi:hypothetical protein